ncbi:hypothetical protein HUJ05_002203 [Dendroctonus ponderosae]|nr:hypothetical protein HUJ05_002203 [Dendroctonus ponderosae]
MRVLIFVLLVGLVAFHVEAKRKRKFEGDFEFDEELNCGSFLQCVAKGFEGIEGPKAICMIMLEIRWKLGEEKIEFVFEQSP